MNSIQKLSTSSAKAKKRRNTVFCTAFEAGAQARANAGLSSPTFSIPKRSTRVPTKYTLRSDRKAWSYGWRIGYAHGLTKEEGKAYPRRPERPQRALPGLTRDIMMGHWQCLSGASTLCWHLSEDGAFTGEIREGKKRIADFHGKWELQGRWLWSDYKSNTYGGAKNARYVQSDPLIKFSQNSFVIELDDTTHHHFRRVTQAQKLKPLKRLT